MKKEQVIALFGEDFYREFLCYMRGRRMKRCPDGCREYHINDIKRFLRYKGAKNLCIPN